MRRDSPNTDTRNFWETAQSRAMCRAYLDRPVPRAKLLRVLEVARRAPSAGHSQGVRFGVVTDAERRTEIAKAYGEEAFVAKGFAPWLSVAPVHVIVATSLVAYEERYSEPDKSCGPSDWQVSYPILDAGKSLMGLYLAATECGLACGYLGPHAGPDLVQELSLPDHWRYLGLVTLGYRDRSVSWVTRSRKRPWRPFDEVVHWVL